MRYAVILVLLAAGLTVAGTVLKQYGGYVELGLESGTYKMPLWYFIVALLVTIVAVMLAIKLLWSVIRMPAIMGRFTRRRREKKAGKLLQEGMLAMDKGQWKKAEKKLAQGARVSQKTKHDSGLFLTKAAEAAQQQGVDVRRDQYLLEAHQLAAEGENTLTAALSEAKLYLNGQSPKKALAALKPQLSMHSDNPQLMAIQSEAFTQLKQYADIWDLLPLMKSTFASKPAYQARQLEVAKLLFDEPSSTLAAVEKTWSELPKAAKKEDGLLLSFVSALLHHGEEDKAEDLLATAIRRDYSDPLIHAYTQLEVGSSTQRLEKVRKWLRDCPNNAYLNYGAAKLAFQSDLLDDARKHAEASLKVMPMPESFALLGKIYEAQNNSEGALQAYKGSVNLTYADQADNTVKGELLSVDTANALPESV